MMKVGTGSGWRWRCYEANGARGVLSGTPPSLEIGLQQGRGGGRVTNGWD